MILVVCTDDPDLEAIAHASAKAHPNVFGKVHRVFTEVPQLARDEALFIIAHGAKDGDDGNPVIGDERQDFFVNAVELYENLKSIFPKGYRGSVYIDACESADHKRGAFSFAEVFKAQIQEDHGGVRVFARHGTVDGLIPLPGSPGWEEASFAQVARA